MVVRAARDLQSIFLEKVKQQALRWAPVEGFPCGSLQGALSTSPKPGSDFIPKGGLRGKQKLEAETARLLRFRGDLSEFQ